MYAVLGLMLVAMAVAQKSLSCAYMKDAPLCCVQDLSLGEADPCNQWEDGFNTCKFDSTESHELMKCDSPQSD